MIFLLLLLSIFGFISVPILRWLWFTSPLKGTYGKKLYASCELSKVYWIVLTEWVNTQNWEEIYQKMITKSLNTALSAGLNLYEVQLFPPVLQWLEFHSSQRNVKLLEEGLLEHDHVTLNTTIHCVTKQLQIDNRKFVHEPTTIVVHKLSCKPWKKHSADRKQ